MYDAEGEEGDGYGYGRRVVGKCAYGYCGGGAVWFSMVMLMIMTAMSC